MTNTNIKRFFDADLGLTTDLGSSLAMPNMYKTYTRQLSREGLVKRSGNRWTKTLAGHAIARQVEQAMRLVSIRQGLI